MKNPTHSIWQDIEIQSLNRVPAHTPWVTEAAHTMSLDGRWKFRLCEDRSTLPPYYYAEDFNDAQWREVDVPGCAETQGEGKPVYTNWMYPFEDAQGMHRLLPGFSAPEDAFRLNPPFMPDRVPVCVYRRSFTLPANMRDRRLFLHFGGVESAFYVWINGLFAGYSEDSKLAAEFDVTELMHEGENSVAVRVMRYSTASWLEDQDYWHLTGIFRTVTLISKPRIYLQDVSIF